MRVLLDECVPRLREELINSATDTRDHTVSDDFVQLLRSRKTIEAT